MSAELARVEEKPSPYYAYLSSLDSPESRRTMRTCLNTIAHLITDGETNDGAEIDWHLMRYGHTVGVRDLILGQDWKPGTVNKHLSALRGVLREAWRLGLMTTDDYHRAKDFRNLKDQSEPVGRMADVEDVGKVVAVCRADPGLIGVRDEAIVWALYVTGARREEIGQVLLSDYSKKDKTLYIRGKGGVGRVLPLNDQAVEGIERWLDTRGREPGPIFLPVRKENRVQMRSKGISGAAIYSTLKKRCEAAGVDMIEPHNWRRTMISDQFDQGTDASTVQALAGHARFDTTRRYDLRGLRARRKAVESRRMPVVK